MGELEEFAASFAELFRRLEWSYGETTKHTHLTADECAVLHPLEKRLYKLIVPNVLLRPRTLYHFTNNPGLAGILSSGGLRATYWRDLADEREIRYGMALVNEVMQFLRGKLQESLQEFLGLLYYAFVQNELEQEYYIVCFTECADSERHWKEYGCANSGFMIGFNCHELQRPYTNVVLDVQPVIYDIKKQVTLINDIVIACWGSALELARTTSTERHWVWLPHIMSLLNTHLSWHLSLIKEDSFAWEREWRVVIRGSKPSANHEQAKHKRYTHIPLLRRPQLSPILAISGHDKSDTSYRNIARQYGYDVSER